jgi:hypothetical protein
MGAYAYWKIGPAGAAVLAAEAAAIGALAAVALR